MQGEVVVAATMEAHVRLEHETLAIAGHLSPNTHQYGTCVWRNGRFRIETGFSYIHAVKRCLTPLRHFSRRTSSARRCAPKAPGNARNSDRRGASVPCFHSSRQKKSGSPPSLALLPPSRRLTRENSHSPTAARGILRFEDAAAARRAANQPPAPPCSCWRRGSTASY